MALSGWVLLLLMLLHPLELPLSVQARILKREPPTEYGSAASLIASWRRLRLEAALPKGKVTPSGPSTCSHYSWPRGLQRCPMKLSKDGLKA